MNEIIHQYRWYDANWRVWSEWRPTRDVYHPSAVQLDDVRYYIKIGKRYQLRTLEQTKLEGWDISTDNSKQDDNNKCEG